MPDLCTPSDMAKWFINRVDREAGEAMTHLKVQKLLYFTQAYFLANFKKPLFEEDFQAWAHGPVVPSVFQEYTGNGWEALPEVEDAPVLDAKVESFLEAVYENFGKFSAKELERISHSHEPWIAARDRLSPEARCTTAIPKEHIQRFYGERIKKRKKAR